MFFPNLSFLRNPELFLNIIWGLPNKTNILTACGFLSYKSLLGGGEKRRHRTNRARSGDEVRPPRLSLGWPVFLFSLFHFLVLLRAEFRVPQYLNSHIRPLISHGNVFGDGSSKAVIRAKCGAKGEGLIP